MLTAALPVCEIPGDHPSEKESEAHVRIFKPTIESAVIYHRKYFTGNFDTFFIFTLSDINLWKHHLNCFL